MTVVAAAAIGYRGVNLNASSVGDRGVVISEWRGQAEFGISDENPSSLVSVVIFSDYFCINCRVMNPAIDSLKEKYSGDISITWRNHPLGSGRSQTAAAAALCADAFDVFPEVHAFLLRQSPFAPAAAWDSTSAAFGVDDPEAFAECVARDATQEAVATDKVAARRLGIRATPMLLVDSTLYAGFPGTDVIGQHVRRASKTSR